VWCPGSWPRSRAYTLLGVIALVLRMPEEHLHRAICGGCRHTSCSTAATWGQAGNDIKLPGLLTRLMFLLVLGVLVWTAWRRETDAPAGHARR